MSTYYDLEGKVAVVTGAAGGFGTAISQRLRDCGATVVHWDLPACVKQHQFAGLPSSGVDITEPKSIDVATAELRSQLGRLDILVNNAGIVGNVAPLWKIPVEEFRRIIDVNLIGSFLVCRALVPLMIETAKRSRAGRIVNVASIQAKEGMHQAAAYSAAKAGLVALTKSLGKELATSDILVNAITPAASLTAMSIDAPKERLDDILSRIPMRRFLEPAEVASMVAWLSSSECSFSTGAVFDLSGGRATY
ncbi:3-oxoacyl-ACP reductase [Rhizobium sp. Root491]|uniref:SDR family NAD(P)-dependent oxidoreductase n=1 Tax=Rhizobium sp. Root491 TaxID=1736548 RepID=UPI000713078B|nr:SDR family NAD(P)-dependent oxidoreductase [Rhizobium sp. Root491]KQY40988.1 3-oxoacyl-ACP reductase [Rhizobium sp. Root491]